MSPKRGVVLVFTAGILTILAAIGMAFYTMTNASVSSAVRYNDMVRAELLAQAGVQEAVARLRAQAFVKTEDPSDPWFQTDYMNGARRRISFAFGDGVDNPNPTPDWIIDNEPGEPEEPFTRALGSTVTDRGDRFTLQVSDAASRINVNAGDNLAVILDNLCRVIGPPLVAADQDALQPRRWAEEAQGTPTETLFSNAQNAADTATETDLCFRRDAQGRPVTKADGTALYGDGYAIAGFRARHGRFGSIHDVRDALTYVERNGNATADDPLERLEIEVKFSALRDYITADSWVDTTTVGVGKFEWVTSKTFQAVRKPRNVGTDTDPLTGANVTVYDLQDLEYGSIDCQVLIDRDKSWIADDPVGDPLNRRGSLRGAYVSIMNGHGAGQLRRIVTNGTDWIAIRAYAPDEQMTVPPGPISSYLIMAREDALLELVPNTTPPTYIARMRTDGSFPDDPAVDYANHPICIHRSPVNINTASDKVLAALFMGINVQHGHPMSVGTVVRDGTTLATGVDKSKLVPTVLKDPPLAFTETDWKTKDYVPPKYTANTANPASATARGMETYLLTMKGVKRIPADSGKLVFNRPIPTEATSPEYDYLHDYGKQTAINEAQELAFRIIHARQGEDWSGTSLPNDPLTGYKRGPFKSWDDFYFRIVKPWDDQRVTDGKAGNEYHIVSRARMIMANFNNNTDILKFNPNIEWIDRWGRNFTEMEPVMIFDNTVPGVNEPLWIPYRPWPPAGASDGYWNRKRVYEFSYQPGSYYMRSLRYKSDDLIDKTDLNRSTTEFSFNSGGVYDVISTGQVMGPIGLLAERKVDTLIKVYDVWRESTQDQFVRGFISLAENATGKVTDPNRSGKIVRDARNTSAPFNRLALDTWPEALVPLQYRLNCAGGLQDVVSGSHFDAWRNAKGYTNPFPEGTPDIVANRVLPARYDGQIALATNTLSYEPADNDTFLASFNGDLDTDTSAGCGRESAKVPCDQRTRVVDLISCLGLLNDKQVDFDPKEPLPGPLPHYDFFAARSANVAMRALDPTKYWENVTCRMGDLRPEGVHLGNVGVSAKDATLKYQQKDNLPCTQNPGTDWQVLVRMWFKPSWHQNDSQEHEFFNCNSVGNGRQSHAFLLQKVGKLTNFRRTGSGNYGGLFENCIWWNFQDRDNMNSRVKLHGGLQAVPITTPYVESPAYRVQPFRWHYIGGALNHAYARPKSGGNRGRWHGGGGSDGTNRKVTTNRTRNFISTQRVKNPTDWWDPSFYYSYIKNDKRKPSDHYFGSGNPSPSKPQIAAWSWSDHVDAGLAKTPIFGLNNVGESMTGWLYRACPIDGTMAVIDELKISSTSLRAGSVSHGVWYDGRIPIEMTTSRYYLPSVPAVRANCPTFTSQTLLQSLRGSSSSAQGETVSVVRVSWNCFTPRFMHENKNFQTARQRVEAIGDTGQTQSLKNSYYRGPFDYIQYNWEILPVDQTKAAGRQCEAEWNPKEALAAGAETVYPLCCDRPSLKNYLDIGCPQAHATAGIEVELLRDPDGNPDSGDETLVDGKTFTNPDGLNRLGTPDNPIHVRTNELRYRVRFRYPVDTFVRQVYGTATATVDPGEHFLLDTPVFDDISVIYFPKVRILSHREVTE